MSVEELSQTSAKPNFEDAQFRKALSTLTPRERQVLDWLIEGQTNKEIGRLLQISPRTVEVHRARVMEKFSTRNTAELVSVVRMGALHTRPSLASVQVGPNRGWPTNPSVLGVRGRPATGLQNLGAMQVLQGIAFLDEPDDGAINIVMSQTDGGAAQGTLVLPPSLQLAIRTLDYPSTANPMSLDSAISYGVFLALNMRTRLVLTGNSDAWHGDWGPLPRDAESAPTRLQ